MLDMVVVNRVEEAKSAVANQQTLKEEKTKIHLAFGVLLFRSDCCQMLRCLTDVDGSKLHIMSQIMGPTPTKGEQSMD